MDKNKVNLTSKYKVIIIGGGYSLKFCDLEKLKRAKLKLKLYFIGVNTAYKLGTWIDCIFTGDCRFIEWNYKELKNWPNPIYTCCLQDFKIRNVIKLTPLKEYDIKPDDPHTVPWPCQKGANSGASAIALAIKMGAKNIYLLGFDGRSFKGKTHWHKYHKAPTPDYVYNDFNVFFEKIYEQIKDSDIKVTIVWKGSAIPNFRKIDFNEFYEEIEIADLY